MLSENGRTYTTRLNFEERGGKVMYFGWWERIQIGKVVNRKYLQKISSFWWTHIPGCYRTHQSFNCQWLTLLFSLSSIIFINTQKPLSILSFKSCLIYSTAGLNNKLLYKFRISLKTFLLNVPFGFISFIRSEICNLSQRFWLYNSKGKSIFLTEHIFLHFYVFLCKFEMYTRHIYMGRENRKNNFVNFGCHLLSTSLYLSLHTQIYADETVKNMFLYLIDK